MVDLAITTGCFVSVAIMGVGLKGVLSLFCFCCLKKIKPPALMFLWVA